MPEASHLSKGPARLALPLTPAERSLVTIAGRFANEMIAPIAESLEREKSALPAAVVAEWIRLGLNGMQDSPEHPQGDEENRNHHRVGQEGKGRQP
jgi:hypothetical protein